ncbi:MAG: CDP-glucose 4,6-dehydratase [Candidatus Glassbacteria bacterium]|nr:CDP-glucose 4,6-dehydratase [Candidatus Glassbacteria bacterium]
MPDSGSEKKLKETYSGRRVMVTGHTGFKGSWLSLWLSSLGASVTGFALDPPTSPSLFELAGVGELLEDLRGDIRDYGFLAGEITRTQPEIIFHLAAQPLVLQSYEEPKETFEVNVGGTVNLLEAARNNPAVRAVVVVTSDKCYSNPDTGHLFRETDPLGGSDPYSASKAAAELVCSAYQQSFFNSRKTGLATARSGNVIGGGDWARDRLVPDTIRCLDSGEPVPVRHPASIRPWQHVLEPTYGYLLLGQHLLDEGFRDGGCSYADAWNFGPAEDSGLSAGELVGKLIADYGSGSWQDVSGREGAAPHEAGMLLISSDKACRRLGWKPRWGLAETVGRTIDWYRRCKAGEDPYRLSMRDIEAYLES